MIYPGYATRVNDKVQAYPNQNTDRVICAWALNYFDDRDKLIIGLLVFIDVYEAAMRVLRNKLR